MLGICCFLSSLQTNRASKHSFERWVGGQVSQLQFRKLGGDKDRDLTNFPKAREAPCMWGEVHLLMLLNPAIIRSSHPPFPPQRICLLGPDFHLALSHAIAWRLLCCVFFFFSFYLFFLLSSLLATTLIVAYPSPVSALLQVNADANQLSKLWWAAKKTFMGHCWYWESQTMTWPPLEKMLLSCRKHTARALDGKSWLTRNFKGE